MKKVFALLIIFVLLLSAACGSPESPVSDNIPVQSADSENSSFQDEQFFLVYHSVLNPDNDAFLNSSPLDKSFSPDLAAAFSNAEERALLQNYIDLWSAELNLAQKNLKALLNESENARGNAISAFEESQTAWENDLDKDIASFSETYLSVWGSGSDIGIYTGYLMLEKVRARTFELIDQILFFGRDYAFTQTSNCD